MPYRYNPFTQELNRIGALAATSGTAVSNFTVFNETPTPAVDGVETTFSVASTYIASTLQVVLDGIQQIKTTDYTESTDGSGFTMVNPPDSDEVLWVNYIKA